MNLFFSKNKKNPITITNLPNDATAGQKDNILFAEGENWKRVSRIFNNF